MSAIASDLGTRAFRAGADYELVAYDRLPANEALLLAELRQDSGFYGILRPLPGSGRTIRAVDRDTALLWLGARSPGTLPFFVWDDDEDRARRRVAQLVLDGVLEVEVDGEFVSGARAAPAMAKPRTEFGAGALSQLSVSALRECERLQITEPEELAARLYHFGVIPMTPKWARLLPDSRATLDFLGASAQTEHGRQLRERFISLDHQSAPAWLAWSPVGRRSPASGEPTYKLYVSVQPEDHPVAFAHVVEVLGGHDHLQFKSGASAAGVLRPDKLVIYFASLEALQVVAEELAPRLAALSPQGVPFSAEVALGGILSWGVDPPRGARVLVWQGSDSWRSSVVRRLATAMIAAQRNPSPDLEPWRYALERLSLDGVDAERWAPPPGEWWLA